MDTINNDCCSDTADTEDTAAVESIITEEEFLLDKETMSQQRLDICKGCPELRALNNCRQCGCFMNIKVRIYSATCPLGLW
jgi:hypothetical protein